MERIKIAQLGMTHEHAAGKMASIKKLPDIYEIVGVVDDRETAKTSPPSSSKTSRCNNGISAPLLHSSSNPTGI